MGTCKFGSGIVGSMDAGGTDSAGPPEVLERGDLSLAAATFWRAPFGELTFDPSAAFTGAGSDDVPGDGREPFKSVSADFPVETWAPVAEDAMELDGPGANRSGAGAGSLRDFFSGGDAGTFPSPGPAACSVGFSTSVFWGTWNCTEITPKIQRSATIIAAEKITPIENGMIHVRLFSPPRATTWAESANRKSSAVDSPFAVAGTGEKAGGGI